MAPHIFRLVQFSDIHIYHPPTWWELWQAPKRFIGFTNLSILGRRKKLSYPVQSQLIQRLASDSDTNQIDQVLCTGDVTNLALPAEFTLAKKTFQPLFNQKTLKNPIIIPGNHDYYVPDGEQSFIDTFGDSCPQFGNLHNLTENISLLPLNPCRPTGFLSSRGNYPKEQLELAAKSLNEWSTSNKFLVIATHYPVSNPDGSEYTTKHPHHGVDNNMEFLAILEASIRKWHKSHSLQLSTTPPPVILVHGHVHKGYTSQLLLANELPRVPTFDPGSAGFAFQPEKHRLAAFNLFEIGSNKQHEGGNFSDDERSQLFNKPFQFHLDWQLNFKRYVYNGATFAAEEKPFLNVVPAM